MEWLQILLSSILGFLTGTLATYLFNVRFYRQRDGEARLARLRGLREEIEANCLLLDAGNLTGQGGRSRLLVNAIQKTQDDWYTFNVDLQRRLRELLAEISIFNIKVDMFIELYARGDDARFGYFFEKKPPEIMDLLKKCKEDLDVYIQEK